MFCAVVMIPGWQKYYENSNYPYVTEYYMRFYFPFLIPEKLMLGLKFYAKKTLFG
jgi:hypothetical protein